MNAHSTEASRVNAQLQWNTNPCGKPLQDIDDTTLEYFLEVERLRYTSDPWMMRVVPFGAASGRKLLEIGCGQGTDLAQFAKAGAECFAVDITQRHIELTRRNFELRGLTVDVRECDATNICFPDNTFDMIYTHGVLHHIYDGEKAFNEAYRVLKPGGIFFVALYNKYSIYHFFSKIIVDGIIRRKLLTLGYEKLLSTIEFGADGKVIAPYVKLYTKRYLRSLLEKYNFSTISVDAAHLNKEHYSVFKKILRHDFFISPLIERNYGWYVYANSIKRQ